MIRNLFLCLNCQRDLSSALKLFCNDECKKMHNREVLSKQLGIPNLSPETLLTNAQALLSDGKKDLKDFPELAKQKFERASKFIYLLSSSL